MQIFHKRICAGHTGIQQFCHCFSHCICQTRNFHGSIDECCQGCPNFPGCLLDIIPWNAIQCILDLGSKDAAKLCEIRFCPGVLDFLCKVRITVCHGLRIKHTAYTRAAASSRSSRTGLVFQLLISSNPSTVLWSALTELFAPFAADDVLFSPAA